MNRRTPPKSSVEGTLPIYATRFRCVGPECEDTCCSGWRISIDKAAFQAYRQMQTGVLVDRFRKRLKLVPSSKKTNSAWGELELDASSRDCSFLEAGACAIHTELGEDYLSDVCHSFPRHYASVGSTMTHGLSLACPEAARLALGFEDALELAETTIEFRTATVTTVVAVLPDTLMVAVNALCARIARTKTLPLWARLALLGIFCDDLTKWIAAGKQEAVQELLSTYEPMLVGQGVSDALSAMPSNHGMQAQLFLSLLRMGASEERSPLRLRIQRAIATGLGVDATWHLDEATLIERYVRGLGRLETALKRTPFLLDHFVQNDMLLEGFPFAGKTPMANYLQLVSRFGIVRLMLAARCNEEPIPEPDELIATIRYFCRRFAHDTNYAAAVNSALADTNDTTVDRLYGFLRS